MLATDKPLKKKRLIRIGDVSEITSLGKSTINLWVAQNRFPKPIKVSATLKVWEYSDIIDWISELKSADIK